MSCVACDVIIGDGIWLPLVNTKPAETCLPDTALGKLEAGSHTCDQPASVRDSFLCGAHTQHQHWKSAVGLGVRHVGLSPGFATLNCHTSGADTFPLWTFAFPSLKQGWFQVRETEAPFQLSWYKFLRL